MSVELVIGIVMAAVPIAGGWAWRVQSDITTLKTKGENEQEWRDEFKKRFDRLEEKIDDLKERR